MSKNANYVIWMVAIAFFALIIGQFVIEPGTVDRNPAASSSSRSKGRHHDRRPPVTQVEKTQPADTAPVVVSEESAQPRLQMTTYNQLRQLVVENPAAITKIVFINGENAVEVTLTESEKATRVTIPGAAMEALLLAVSDAGIEVDAREAPGESGIYSFLKTFGPAILIIGVILLISGVFRRRQMGGGFNGFGSSKAKSIEQLKGSVDRVSFDDIAGCDEAVRELKRIVVGLVDEDVYRHFKADRPSGVLLEGPPGTGKTLLARAVAAACDGTMDIVSGSDFVEMFVGVGASRVRDMVTKGKANVKKTGKPHIIFIDEIDAIGGKRGSGTSMNRNDEREQTLNAILVAMDGVESSDGLIWIAATNRADMLDDALMRPGRFDSLVRVDLPDRSGRAKIFAIHSRGMPLAREITCDKLATRTYGYSGAQIKLACNRAALLAAERWAAANQEKLDEYRRNKPKGEAQRNVQHFGMGVAGYSHTFVTEPSEEEKKEALENFQLAICANDPTAVIRLTDFDEAIDFVLYGDANESRQAAMRQEEKRNTAYHEGGHALAAEAMEGADPVAKITVMSRSKALGYVQQIPEDERFSITDKQLVARIVVAMAGRAAQEVYLGTVDTGAQNDFEQATDLARRMVTEWGMSRLGHIAVGGRTSIAMRGGGAGSGPGYGPELANQIDAEWRRIVEACYSLALTLVEKEKVRMEQVVSILLDRETILKDEWQALMSECPTAIVADELSFNPREKNKDKIEEAR